MPGGQKPPAQAQPAVNLDSKPLTVEERDNLIRQINSLTA